MPPSLNLPIKIENLDFRYGTRRLVLENINMTIKPGEKIALVGESGSGKTTLSKLLLNFYPWEKGGDKHGDKANIVKAPNLTPAPVIPSGLPEAELIAYIAEAKYLLGEPLYRMEQHFKMQGIYLNRTSLANWIIKASEWLIPVVTHFWKYAYLEPVLNADETTLRVLKIQGKPVKKLGQMWVICTGASAKLLIAIYTYRDNRSKVTAEELLGGYDGIVQTDGFQSYGSGDYLHAGCWSHARRKFVDSIPENDKNSKAAKAVEIIDRAFALEREARKANVPPEKILEMRQKEVRPIIEEFYSFIGTLRPSKGSHLGAAVFLLPYVLAVSAGVAYGWAVCLLALAAAAEEWMIHLCQAEYCADRRSFFSIEMEEIQE